VTDRATEYYAGATAMTALPDHPALAALPSDLDALRRVVQGLLVHRDWATVYGIAAEDVRTDEQNLRSIGEVLQRAFELSDAPVTVARAPIERVLCICRHYTLLHTALLRAVGIPARVRCGFSNYFDPAKWYDHWITERFDGERWVRDDPQIDEVQAKIVNLDFDPYDQPAGKFLSGNEAWRAVRRGELDPTRCGIFDMWGQNFVGGNVLLDFACLNKVELLPWDVWGLTATFGPHDTMDAGTIGAIDDIAALVTTDDVDAIRDRYERDDRLQVPSEIITFINGEMRTATLAL
jgi:hypothetical protein